MNAAAANKKLDRVVAIVPCLNEESAVGDVVRGLRESLGAEAEIYVYDNGSSDNTVDVATAAGAQVRLEARRGKGNVLRRAFADLEADFYVIIDGDHTYDAAEAVRMVDLAASGPYDHIHGVRRALTTTAYRRGHFQGNRALNAVTGWIFGTRVNDMLSGYRVFSRRFVKSFPALSRGFEIETELTIHALELRVPQLQVEVGFQDRTEGSSSKLRTYRDGLHILLTIVKLAHYLRPAVVYSWVAAALAVVSLLLGLPVVIEYVQTGLVPRFPTAILAATTMTIAFLLLVIGLLQDAVRRSREENSRLWYLSLPAPSQSRRDRR